MTAIAAVPCTNLEWRQWVRRMVEELGLPSAEAHLLQVLGDRASGTGTIRLGVPLLARQLGGISESQVYRRLNALARRGILRTRQQGHGRIAVRELIAVHAPAQLSLFDASGVPMAAVTPDPAPPREAPPAPAPWPGPPAPAGVACPRMDAAKPSHPCEAAVPGQFEEKDARAARAPHPEINDPNGVLAPRLGEVLGILEPALGLIVEPMAFHSALAAFPEERGHDHVQAAHIVASYGFEGEVRSPVSLLRQVLRNQLQPVKEPRGRQHGGRRRPAPPVSPAMAEQEERQTATMWRLAAAAGFGGPR